jgi:outer membrane protein OmpU
MRKALVGTTALVAAGLAAGQASAASGLKLGITGFYRGAIGATIGGDSSLGFATTSGGGPGVAGFGNAGRTDTGFRQEIRLNFTGETTLDNGITIGVLVGINGENLIAVGSTTTPQKRSYADFKGKFGDIRFGEFETALTTDCITDPGNVTANFGVNSPNESFSDAGRGVDFFGAIHNRTVGVAPMGSIGTCYGIESRGTKIGYFSPTFGGFTFGVTYTPSGSTRNPGGGYFYGTDLKNRRADNVISAGADFNHDFGGGITLTVGGGGEWAIDSYTALGESVSDKPSTYLLGAQVGLPGGFTVGASGALVYNYKGAGYAATDAFNKDDAWIATLGANYTVDAVSIGIQGIYSRWQVYGDSAHDAIWGASLNGAYALGPGINLEAQVAYTKYLANGFGGPPFIDDALGIAQPASYSAVEIDGGFAINF